MLKGNKIEELIGMNPDYTIVIQASRYGEMWQDKDDVFWLDKFAEEFAELVLAVHGKHEHSPELELIEIASMAINWIKKMQIDSENKNDNYLVG